MLKKNDKHEIKTNEKYIKCDLLTFNLKILALNTSDINIKSKIMSSILNPAVWASPNENILILGKKNNSDVINIKYWCLLFFILTTLQFS